MDVKKAIEELKEYVANAFESTKAKLGSNIYRGHLRSISTDIEDGIALFVSKILPDCKLFLDASIHVGGKNNRPDLMVVDKNDKVVAIIEIKANMGWCRDAKKVLDGICENNTKFANAGTLCCKFSNDDKQSVTYGNDVKLFLISLTGENGSSNLESNRNYAKSVNVFHFNLFWGWYYDLREFEIEDFANELLK